METAEMTRKLSTACKVNIKAVQQHAGECLLLPACHTEEWVGCGAALGGILWC